MRMLQLTELRLELVLPLFLRGDEPLRPAERIGRELSLPVEIREARLERLDPRLDVVNGNVLVLQYQQGLDFRVHRSSSVNYRRLFPNRIPTPPRSAICRRNLTFSSIS